MVGFGIFEHDKLIEEYEHLRNAPRADEALHTLRKIASLVKPIMRKHGWKVHTLQEFYPNQANLLGMNVNSGRRVCLRLRQPFDQTQFLELESVVDTMLHELSHNVFGPHNQDFHDLWNKLRDEYDELKYKGYTGEGFLTQGHRLGGARMPMQEMRRQARAVADQRKVLQRNSGKKLGGRTPSSAEDIRTVIADAAARRGKTTSITQGCASGSKDTESIAAEASRNGFRTKAEEDAANERAISDALWELVQEEEFRKAGLDPQAWRTEGLVWNPATGLEPANLAPRDAPPAAVHLSSRSSTQPAHTAPARKPLLLAATGSNGLHRSASTKDSISHTSKRPAHGKGSKPDDMHPSPIPALVSPLSPHNHSRQSSQYSTEATSSLPSRSNTTSTHSRPATSTTNTSSIPPPSSNATKEDELVDLSNYDDDYEFEPFGTLSPRRRPETAVNPPHPTIPRTASSSISQRSWQCPVCTLCNKFTYLACEVCGSTRPHEPTDGIEGAEHDHEVRNLQRGQLESIIHRDRASGLAELSAGLDGERRARAVHVKANVLAPRSADEVLGERGGQRPQKRIWNCMRCQSAMEPQWWTCSLCGKMKEGWQ